MTDKIYTKTLKIRVKDKHISKLQSMAFSVNQVWNYCNELSQRSIKERNQWLSGYDLQQYTKGANKELGLNSATVQMIGHEYVTRRKQFKKIRLNWRKSNFDQQASMKMSEGAGTSMLLSVTSLCKHKEKQA